MNDAQHTHLTVFRPLFQPAAEIFVCVNEINIMDIIEWLGEWTRC